MLKRAWESRKPISYEDAKELTEEREKGFEATEKQIREEIEG